MIASKKRIMVVDDVKEVLSGISIILSSEGYDVLEASNGRQALKKLDNSVDLVVSDILMPEMDGIELCQKMKIAYPDIKVILISGGGRQPSEKAGYDYLTVAKKLTGVNKILKKPFNPEELLQMITDQFTT